MNTVEFLPYVGTRKQVRLQRAFASEPLHNGFVLGISDKLVLLRQFRDFYDEGYTVLRLADIVSVRSGEYERHWERMLSSEGLLNSVKIDAMPALDGFSELLVDFAIEDRFLIVELESKDNPDDDLFMIGKVDHVDGEIAYFRHFDGLGIWEDKLLKVPTQGITTVQFETPYIRHLRKYLTEPNE